MFVGVIVLTTAQLLAAGGWTPVNTVHVGLVVGLAAGWFGLRGAPSERRTLWIAMASLTLISAGSVFVGHFNADMPRTTLTLIAVMLGAAVLMPWGARYQAMAASVAGVLLGIGAALEEGSVVTARDVALLLAMLLSSVFIAQVLERQRRQLEQEQTQRLQDQEALRLSEELFRTIFESAAIGMARIDATGAIIEANDALGRILGRRADAMRGMAFRDLLDEGGLDGELFDALASGRCRSHQADWHYRHVSGEDVWGHTTISSLDAGADDGGKTLVAVVDDITVRKQAERKLAEARDAAEAAAAAKGRFLAIMSHEIRTPLNAVLGFNELLAGTDLDPTQTHFVDTIGQSGRHLNDIVNDVLDFSKIESGALELERAPIDVADVVGSAVRMFEGAARKKGVSLVFDVASRMPGNLIGDPKRIRQVATNLVSNAIKFTKQGTVSVRLGVGTTTADRAVVELEVSDTGLGIATADCEHLFEPFVQADSATTRKHGGTGLGLAICKQLVDLMGGAIRVDSSVGQGSRFTVVVPLERTEEATLDMPVVSRAMRVARDTLRGLRVLVVEDDPTNAALMERLLSRVGCVVERATDGADALVALARHSHPIVMMDIDMPVMDGREATRRIRTQFGPDVQPYVIAVTAHVMPGDRDSFVRAGMNDYVSKPIHADELSKALERAIGDSGAAPLKSLGDAEN